MFGLIYLPENASFLFITLMNPRASLITGILCISFAPIFVRLAAAPPVTSAFYRMFIAFLALLPYCIVKGKLKAGRNELIYAIAGGVIFGADIALWNISLTKTSATVSTLIANLSPVWVGILSFLLYRKSSGKQFWIGTVLAIAGIVILAGYKNIMALNLNDGILLALLSSLLYAVYILLTKSIIKDIGTLTFVFYNLLGATLFSFAVCAFQQNVFVSFSTQTWLCFAGSGLICQLAGWLTITHALRFLPSTKVSLALLSRAVIACFWAFLFLNERLSIYEITGSIIVLAGIAVTFLKPGKPAA